MRRWVTMIVVVSLLSCRYESVAVFGNTPAKSCVEHCGDEMQCASACPNVVAGETRCDDLKPYLQGGVCVESRKIKKSVVLVFALAAGIVALIRYAVPRGDG